MFLRYAQNLAMKLVCSEPVKTLNIKLIKLIVNVDAGDIDRTLKGDLKVS